MRSIRFFLLAAALVAAVPAQSAQPPLVLAPVTKWNADYATENCALRRAFEGDGKKMILELNSFTYGSSFQVKVYSPDLAVSDRVPRTRFEPDAKATKQDAYVRVTFADGKRGILYRDTVFPYAPPSAGDVVVYPEKAKPAPTEPAPDLAARDRREREITGLLIEDAFAKDVLLRTGSLHLPMEAMRACLADLAKSEGLDPQKIATLSRGPQPKDLQRLVRQVQQNYPDEMVRAGKSASLDIRLIVDEQGKPIDCKTRDNGQDAAFTATTCPIVMKNTQFDPALDAEGKPAKAYWWTTVIYSL